MEPFIGQIQLFGFNFAPRGWALCDGQLLPINQNSALFSLLGTIYGGDGRTSFALPDLRGRVPTHMGTGPGLTPRQIGERIGEEHVTLQISQIPSHTHNPVCSDAAANQHLPGGHAPADEGNQQFNLFTDNPTTVMRETSRTGGGQSHDNMQPTLCVNYCIALQGIFPSRS